jgi:hypothetical protein
MFLTGTIRKPETPSTRRPETVRAAHRIRIKPTSETRPFTRPIEPAGIIATTSIASAGNNPDHPAASQPARPRSVSQERLSKLHRAS